MLHSLKYRIIYSSSQRIPKSAMSSVMWYTFCTYFEHLLLWFIFFNNTIAVKLCWLVVSPSGQRFMVAFNFVHFKAVKICIISVYGNVLVLCIKAERLYFTAYLSKTAHLPSDWWKHNELPRKTDLREYAHISGWTHTSANWVWQRS